jgi:hypothetical protein
MKKPIVLVVLVVLGFGVFLGGVAFAEQAALPAEPAPVPVDPKAEELRKTCVDAMNANPEFAKSIVLTADKQIDQRTINAQLDAAKHIAKNKQSVILAYAAMWIIATLFVVFLWRRQQALKLEILQLRKDLDAAAKEAK